MPKLSLHTKLAFGIGQVAEGIQNGAFNIFLFFYYNQVLGLSGSLAGAAILIALVIDAASDPLVGSISDNLRHRWGRRHPLMYVSAVPAGLAFYLLFDPGLVLGHGALGQWTLFAWLTLWSVLSRQALTLYHVPHLALGAELSDHYEERTAVVAFRVLFGVIGLLLVIILAWNIFFRATSTFANGQLNPHGYPPFGATFGVVMLVTITLSALGTHSRIPFLPKPPADAPPLSARRLLQDVRRALTNRSFRFLAITVLIFFVTRGVQEALGLHMGTYFWKLSTKQIQLIQVAGVAGLIVGIPLWTAVARQIDKKPTLLIGLITFSLFTLFPPLAQILGVMPPPESPAYMQVLVGMAAVAAFGGAAGLVAAGSMMADVADEHELETGLRQEGIFFGALSLAGKSASGIGHGIAGVGIDIIKFPAHAVVGEVPHQTLVSLGLLYGPGVAILAAIATGFSFGYRLNRQRHAEIVDQLAVRRVRRGAGAGHVDRSTAPHVARGAVEVP